MKKKVAIVGKGVTFDSGGYNLKAGAGSMIEMMKVGGIAPLAAAAGIASAAMSAAGSAAAPAPAMHTFLLPAI